jgi:hypothetical protein
VNSEQKQAIRNLVIYLLVKTIILVTIRVLIHRALVKSLQDETSKIHTLAEEVRAGKKDFSPEDLRFMQMLGREPKK